MFAYISLVLTQTDIDITEWVVPHRNETHNNVEHVGGICDVRHIPHLKDTAWSDVLYNKTNMCMMLWPHINGLVQDCDISSMLAMEILQPYTKPSIYTLPNV